MEPLNIVVAAAVIVAFVEVAKKAVVPSCWAGLVAAVVGLVGGAVGWVEGGALAGLIAGLTASGAYSGSKAAINLEMGDE